MGAGNPKHLESTGLRNAAYTLKLAWQQWKLKNGPHWLTSLWHLLSYASVTVGRFVAHYWVFILLSVLFSLAASAVIYQVLKFCQAIKVSGFKTFWWEENVDSVSPATFTELDSSLPAPINLLSLFCRPQKSCLDTAELLRRDSCSPYFVGKGGCTE